MFVEDLFTFLSDAGTTAGSRVYPLQLPQGVVLPACTYSQVSDPPEHTHSGRSSLRRPRFQINCWGETYLAAKTLAAEVIALLDGFSGTMGSTTAYAGFVEDGRDNMDPVTGRHWVGVGVVIWHRET